MTVTRIVLKLLSIYQDYVVMSERSQKQDEIKTKYTLLACLKINAFAFVYANKEYIFYLKTK